MRQAQASSLATNTNMQTLRCSRHGICRLASSTISRPAVVRQCSLHRRLIAAAVQPDAADQQQEVQDDFEGLLPEEDTEVPGNYMDAMNSNTKLGKAVRAAVEELEHLGDLETDVLQQCDDLLKKLGMKGSIFGSSPPAQAGKDCSTDAGSSSN